MCIVHGGSLNEISWRLFVAIGRLLTRVAAAISGSTSPFVVGGLSGVEAGVCVCVSVCVCVFVGCAILDWLLAAGYGTFWLK